jgi:hypothetical protein
MGHTQPVGKPEKEALPSRKEKTFIDAGTSGVAGVVLRATVETFGPVGDAELHLTVKWPAAALAAVGRAASDGEDVSSGKESGHSSHEGLDAPRSSPTPKPQ